MTVPAVRRAGAEDAAELTRLRVIMFLDMGRDARLLDQDWQQRNIEHFRRRLEEDAVFAAFVIDKPAGGLAASAVGWHNQQLIGTRNQTGRTGYIANMSTDPAFRRRGYGRAALVALLDWMRSTGLASVDLHATPDAEHLYRSIGFTEPADTALSLRLN